MNASLKALLNEQYKLVAELREENKNLELIQETNEKQIQNDIKERDELREENRKLKDKIEHLEFDIEAWKKLKTVWEKKEQKLQIEIGGLMGERDGLQMVVERLHKEIEEQDEENKKLKERIDELEKCNLNLQERLDRKEELNKGYRKQIDKYKRQYEHSMGEDDELIYEEGLYD